ncbi:hypothetical protein LTR22_004158 [Elasticomyces elasticus]|nr:hypothetical protein LTR22_004158 [Elasticomyces elasticus]
MSSPKKSAAKVVRSQTAPPPSHGRPAPSATSSSIDLAVPRYEVVNAANGAGPNGSSRSHAHTTDAESKVKSERPHGLQDRDFKVKEILDWRLNQDGWAEYLVIWSSPWVYRDQIQWRGTRRFVLCAELYKLPNAAAAINKYESGVDGATPGVLKPHHTYRYDADRVYPMAICLVVSDLIWASQRAVPRAR